LGPSPNSIAICPRLSTRAIPFVAPAPVDVPDHLSTEAIPPTIREPLLAKLTVNLPVDQLGLASLQSRVVFAMIEDEMNDISTNIARTEQEMEELESRVRSVASKAQNVKQTAAIVQAKSRFLNDWIETVAEKSTVMNGAYIIESLMWVFTIITTVLQLLWNRNQREKRR
jgi:outer membrane murein-binding lipoprotein Lpp